MVTQAQEISNLKATKDLEIAGLKLTTQKLQDKEIPDIKASFKKLQDIEIASLKANVYNLTNDREREIVNLKETIEELRAHARRREAQNTTLTMLKVTGEQERDELKKKIAASEEKIAALEEKVVATERERDQAIKRASLAVNGKGQTQKPGSQLRGLLNSIDADPRQSTRKQDHSSKQPQAKFRLFVMTYDYKKGEFRVEADEVVRSGDFPAGLDDLRKKATSMFRNFNHKSTLRVVMERTASVSGKPFAFANDTRYPAWIKDVGQESTPTGGAAARSTLRCIRVYIFNHEDAAQANSLIRALAE